MELAYLIASRYSVRAYRPVDVEPDKVEQVLEAARLAPTAANRQPVQIVVVSTEGRQDELKRIYRPDWFVQAPLVLCVCAVHGTGWTRQQDGKSYDDVDAAIVMDHLILAATEAGLGTCWIGAFDPDAARDVLELPDNVEPVVFTPLGYPADQPGPKRRKPLSELVRRERW
jgi:nitroreductase